MLKKISAALIVASLFAAPALAAGRADTAPAPVAKSVQAKSVQTKPGLLNASAKMGRHHHRHFRMHHRSHKRMGAIRSHQFSKVTVKHVAHATKRG